MPGTKCPTVRSGGTTSVRSALMPILMNSRASMETFSSRHSGARGARARNPYSRSWLWIPGLRQVAHPGMTLGRDPSLRRRQMPDLVRNLARNRRRPWRAAAALDVDFHPVDFPAARRPDTVHSSGTLDAAGALVVEEHERLLAS